MSCQTRRIRPAGKPSCWPFAARVVAVLLAAFFSVPAQAEIIDRVVAVVGNDAITESQVKEQLDLQALIEGQPPVENIDPKERLQTINRLIERELVQREMAIANFPAEDETRVAAEIEQLRAQRFGNGLNFTAALQAYGLTESSLRSFLREKNSVLDFIDFRFKTGLQIPNGQIEEYYREVYLPAFQQANSSAPPPIETVSDQIEEILREREIEPKVDEWLNQLRLRYRVAILSEPAHQPRDTGE